MHILRIFLCVSLNFLIIVACAKPSTQVNPKIEMQSGAVTAPLPITISLLQPDTLYQVSLQISWVDNQKYCSSVKMLSDREGIIDTSISPAVAGSYKGVDVDGLFWSATPCGQSATERLAAKETDEIKYPVFMRIDVSNASFPSLGRSLASYEITRSLWSAPIIASGRGSVTEHIILAGDGENNPENPLIFMFGGSSPGFPSLPMAGQIADLGLDVISIAYFGLPTTSKCLAQIDVDQVTSDILALIKTYGEGRDIVLHGASRGGELVSLLDLDTLPSAIVFNSSHAYYLGATTSDSCRNSAVSAWRKGEQDVPAILASDFVWKGDLASTVLSATTEMPELASKAEIRLHSFPQRVLTIAAENDTVTGLWASKRIRENLLRHAQSYSVEHYEIPNAGHDLAGYGRVPISRMDIREYGGIRSAQKYARSRSKAQKQYIQIIYNFYLDGN